MKPLMPNQVKVHATQRTIPAGVEIHQSLQTAADPPVQTSAMRVHYRDRLFARSLLESSPAGREAIRWSFSTTTRASNRADSQLHQLKQRLLQARLAQTSAEVWFKPICGAANRAAELAWESACPLLVFPCLFEELVQTVQEQGRNCP
jgi:hypothetical protein